jgi:hypothetical protein
MSFPTLTRNQSAAGPQLYWMDNSGDQYEVERDTLTTDIEGEHLCTLLGVSDPFAYTSREWGEKTGIRFLFEVAAGERQGDRFSLFFGYSIGKKAKMSQVVEALQRAPIADGQEIALGDLLGERCYVFVTVTDTVKDGTTYSNVNFQGARAYTPKAKAQQPAATTARKATMTPAQKAAAIDAADDPFNDVEE